MLAAAVAALMFAGITSCNKENKECYVVNYVIPATEAQYDENGNEIVKAQPATDYETYKWASAETMSAYVESLKAEGFTEIEYKKSPKFKTEIECLDDNKQLD